MEKTGHEMEEKMEEDILIKAPAITRVVGIIGLLSGCLMSFWCYQDYLNGNETASVGIALGFLMIPGTLGIWLLCYGFRLVRVKGEEILFRDFLLRRHFYHMDDICRVEWEADGCAFMGERGKLFKIYDYGCSCEMLLEELEMRGVEVDIPGRVFGSTGIAASHPCPARRHFTVRFTAWSVHAVGRLEVKGREISVHRWLDKDMVLPVTDIKEVRIKVNKEGRMFAWIYLKNGRRLAKLSSIVTDGRDGNCVFAFLRHLKDMGIPMSGIEDSWDDVQCMMRRGFVGSQAAHDLFQDEYGRLLPVFKEYGSLFSKIGLKLVYGCVGREDKINLDKELLGIQPRNVNLEFGYFFCLIKDGGVVFDKKLKMPLYLCFQIISRAPGPFASFGTKAITPPAPQCADDRDDTDLISDGYFYFNPAPERVVKGILDMFLNMVKKKKVKIQSHVCLPEDWMRGGQGQ